MPEHIEWEDYLPTDSDEPFRLPSAQEIENAEGRLGVKLPLDYADCLLAHQGQAPEDVGIIIGKSTEPVGCLFHVYPEGPEKNYSIDARRNRLVQEGITTLIPFADNTSGSLFCFDYSEKEESPKVVFVNSDYPYSDPQTVRVVASSFAEFLGLLEAI